MFPSSHVQGHSCEGNNENAATSMWLAKYSHDTADCNTKHVGRFLQNPFPTFHQFY